ncbi:MAG: methyltransferase domain-containing protein [Chloroflexota bacterium]|nr:methyltransferase domain-containing protein [Chloroflexota bacterium]
MATTVSTTVQDEWTSDFFGSLNEVPAEPVAGIAQILEAMGTEPGFRAARLGVLRDLGLRDGASVLEAGCGTGVALPDLIEVGGPNLQVMGFDPTDSFVALARARAARLGARQARYERGDIRALPLDGDPQLDAAFCDKVLIHAGPTAAALRELIRVVRPGGRVGAIEWYPQFCLSTTDPAHEAAVNAMFRRICNDYTVAGNLARHFKAAGLQDIQTRTSVTHADNLDDHPFWRAFLIEQLPMFVHAEVLDPQIGQMLAEDLQRLSASGNFHSSVMICTAVGTKSA